MARTDASYATERCDRRGQLSEGELPMLVAAYVRAQHESARAASALVTDAHNLASGRQLSLVQDWRTLRPLALVGSAA